MNIRNIEQLKFVINHSSYDKDTLYQRMNIIRIKIRRGENNKISKMTNINFRKVSLLINTPSIIKTSKNPWTTILNCNKIIKAFCKLRYDEVLEKFNDEKYTTTRFNKGGKEFMHRREEFIRMIQNRKL